MRIPRPDEKTPLDQRFDAGTERADTLRSLPPDEDPEREQRRKTALAILELGLIVRGAP